MLSRVQRRHDSLSLSAESGCLSAVRDVGDSTVLPFLHGLPRNRTKCQRTSKYYISMTLRPSLLCMWHLPNEDWVVLRPSAQDADGTLQLVVATSMGPAV